MEQRSRIITTEKLVWLILIYILQTFMVELERSDNTVAQCDLMYQGYRIAYHRQTLEFGGNVLVLVLVYGSENGLVTVN